MQKLIWVLWPSFWMAALAEGVFFFLVDPQQLYWRGSPVNLSPVATYSIGFFAFWALCAASSLATVFYQRGADEINAPHPPPGGNPRG